MSVDSESKKINSLMLLLIFLMLCSVFGHATTPSIYIFFQYLLIGLSIIRVLIHLKNKQYVKYTETFKYLLWFFTFLIYLFISTRWSLNRTLSMNLFKGLIQTLLLILPIVVYATDEKKVKKVFKALVFSYLYMCLRIIFFETASPGTLQFGSVVGYHFNRIAVTLSYGILLCFYLFKTEKKIPYLFLIPIFYYIILLTGSRKGLIMPIAFLSFFMVLSMGKSLKKMVKNTILVIMLLVMLFFIIDSNPELKVRVLNLYNSIVNKVVTTDGSINERKYFRDTAMDLFKQNPIKGIGADGFRAYLLRIGYTKTISYSHCNYTELLATLGIIGFVVYYYIYVLILKKGLTNYSSKKNYKLLAITYVVIQTIFEYGFVSYYMFEFQIVLALMYLNIQNESRREIQ